MSRTGVKSAEGNLNGEMRQLLRMIDEPYSGRSWHGPNLRGVLASISPGSLRRRPGRGRLARETLIHGIAARNLYHVGQIQRIKRLMK